MNYSTRVPKDLLILPRHEPVVLQSRGIRCDRNGERESPRVRISMVLSLHLVRGHLGNHAERAIIYLPGDTATVSRSFFSTMFLKRRIIADLRNELIGIASDRTLSFARESIGNRNSRESSASTRRHGGLFQLLPGLSITARSLLLLLDLPPSPRASGR